MFDKLPGSSKNHGENSRARRFFLVTGLCYAFALFGGAVVSVLLLNPNLVEAFNVSTMLAPPVPPPAAPPVSQPRQATRVKVVPTVTTFTPPTKPPEKIPDPKTVTARPILTESYGIPNGKPSGDPNGVPDGVKRFDEGVPPPPPPPTPKPTPEATPKPEPPKQVKVSGGVLQGSAVSKVQPGYPAIAKAARASGAVQVQVTISEEGQVMEAVVVGGHPLLRDAALQAARQWKFRPTQLSGVPVKVQGVLTFNFTLQ